MSIYHMCTTQQPKQEGWIVVGVDNILEHFIYRVLTHQRQNRGVAGSEKDSNSFFFLLAYFGCIHYVYVCTWG